MMRIQCIFNSVKLLFIIVLALGLTGCFIRPYKFTLYQGNDIQAEQVSQIQVGMSKEQVRYLLGTPLLQDVFHAERWDYVYLEKPGYKKGIERHFSIYFDKDERVARVHCLPLSQ